MNVMPFNVISNQPNAKICQAVTIANAEKVFNLI